LIPSYPINEGTAVEKWGGEKTTGEKRGGALWFGAGRVGV